MSPTSLLQLYTMHGWHRASPAVQLRWRPPLSIANCTSISTMQTLRLVVTLNQILPAHDELCPQRVVAPSSQVDVTRMWSYRWSIPLAVVSRHGAASGRALMAMSVTTIHKRSIAKRNCLINALTRASAKLSCSRKHLSLRQFTILAHSYVPTTNHHIGPRLYIV